MKCLKLFELSFWLMWFLYGDAQISHVPTSGDYITGGTYSKQFRDAFSFKTNIAGIAETDGFSAGLNAERKWKLAELTNFSLAVVLPAANAGIGLTLQQSGDADYNEQQAELGYAKNLGRFSIGIKFGFLKINAAGYASPFFTYSGFGFMAGITDKLNIGWELDMPVFGKTPGPESEKAPSVFRFGMGYEWGSGLLLSFEVNKETGIAADIIGSLLYRYSGQFGFSVGISTNTGSIVFQAGWGKNRLVVQIYTAYLPSLGFSPGLLLLWKGKTKNQ